MRFNSFSPIGSILAAVVIAVTVLATLFDVVRIEGRSMEPVLPPGQNVLVFRGAYGLQTPVRNHYLIVWDKPRKDAIIVYTVPVEYHTVVKRVAGTGGDPFSIHDEMLLLNGRRFRLEPDVTAQLDGLTALPDGTVFVVGDNEPVSRDSRHYGVISIESVHGRVMIPSRRQKRD